MKTYLNQSKNQVNIYRKPTDRNKKLQGIKKKTSGDPEKVYMTKDFENCRKSIEKPMKPIRPIRNKSNQSKLFFHSYLEGAKWAWDCRAGFCVVFLHGSYTVPTRFLHGSYTVPVGSALSPGTGWWGDRSKMAPE